MPAISTAHIPPKGQRFFDNLSAKNLIAVHMTDYAPNDGFIHTTAEKTKKHYGLQRGRDSVHFSLNHPVWTHPNGSWENKCIAIIAPLTALLRANGKRKIVGGTPIDIWSHGAVKLPNNSYIIFFDPKIPKGRLEFLGPEILNKVRLNCLATSERPYDTVPDLLNFLGFKNINIDKDYNFLSEQERTQRSATFVRNMNGWKKFVEKMGWLDGIHFYSPEHRSLECTQLIHFLSQKNNWTRYVDKHKFDLKKVILRTIDELQKTKSRSKSEVDLGKLQEIVESAKTPRSAAKRVRKELKVGFFHKETWRFNLKQHYDCVIGITQQAKKIIAGYNDCGKKSHLTQKDLKEL